MAIYFLPSDPIFPDPLVDEVNDIVAIGGDLTPERILTAYRKGIFPWYDENSPILWWSPDPRLVLFPEELHIPRRLRRVLRQKRFALGINSAFSQVINMCARVRTRKGEGTWLVPEMIEAYTHLHHLGYVHSIEIWHKGKLVGGLYGMCIGAVFFGESMFHIMSDASKVALVALVLLFKKAGGAMIDCQQVTSHLMRFGARPIPRRRFLLQLKEMLNLPSHPLIWQPQFMSPHEVWEGLFREV